MSIAAVPVISIASLLNNNFAKKEETIHGIKKACQNYGFFYISNHGVSLSLMKEFTRLSHLFFQSPCKELQDIKRNQGNSRGYFNDELTKNQLDWKECFDFGAQDGALDATGRDGFNQWPSEKCLDFETTMRLYFSTMKTLSAVLCSAIATGLDLPADHFKSFFEKHTSFLRLNYYRKCPTPDDTMAVHHHTDAGALTILLQDENVTSLQVFHNGGWMMIPPRAGTFVINIGDMMQVWTNDVYKAPLHRVLASSRERHSAPFFYNPSYAVNVQPLVESTEKTVLYRAVNWGNFRAARFAGDYANIGEETQIKHFRIVSKEDE